MGDIAAVLALACRAIFAMLFAVAACGCNGAAPPPVDAGLAAFCSRRFDSDAGCSAECFTATSTAATGACADEASMVNASPDFAALSACVAAMCSRDGGRTRSCAMGGLLTDCECGAACVGMRTAAFQAAFSAMAICFDAEIAGACY